MITKNSCVGVLSCVAMIVGGVCGRTADRVCNAQMIPRRVVNVGDGAAESEWCFKRHGDWAPVERKALQAYQDEFDKKQLTDEETAILDIQGRFQGEISIPKGYGIWFFHYAHHSERDGAPGLANLTPLDGLGDDDLLCLNFVLQSLLNDREFARLLRFRKLRALALHPSKDFSSIARLREFPELAIFSIHDWTEKDFLAQPGVLNAIVAHKSLRTLGFVNCLVTPTVLEQLAKMPNLQVIHIVGNQAFLTDESLAKIAKLKKLVRFHYDGSNENCRFTDAGFRLLGECKTLDTVRVENAPLVSDAAIQAVREALPEASVKIRNRPGQRAPEY